MKQTRKILFSAIAALTIIFTACSKDSDDSQSTLKIRMTDAPLAVEEVNVDLVSVQVKFARDTNSWVTMQANPGVYNLLGLQNGIDTLIAQGTYPTGLAKEIRLILGTNNTIKVDGQVYPLTIPSGAETGLKIKIDKSLQATIETVLIDFDAALSIKEENGSWKLRPVIKLK